MGSLGEPGIAEGGGEWPNCGRKKTAAARKTVAPRKAAAVSFATGLQVANLSDVGMRRRRYQDSLAVGIGGCAARCRDRAHLLTVAGGTGGHGGGRLASKLAAAGIPRLYHKCRDVSAPEA